MALALAFVSQLALPSQQQQDPQLDWETLRNIEHGKVPSPPPPSSPTEEAFYEAFGGPPADAVAAETPAPSEVAPEADADQWVPAERVPYLGPRPSHESDDEQGWEDPPDPTEMWMEKEAAKKACLEWCAPTFEEIWGKFAKREDCSKLKAMQQEREEQEKEFAPARSEEQEAQQGKDEEQPEQAPMGAGSWVGTAWTFDAAKGQMVYRLKGEEQKEQQQQQQQQAEQAEEQELEERRSKIFRRYATDEARVGKEAERWAHTWTRAAAKAAAATKAAVKATAALESGPRTVALHRDRSAKEKPPLQARANHLAPYHLLRHHLHLRLR
jgi:hypothetical protein